MGYVDTSAILAGKWAIVDTVIVLQNIVIAAWAMGVGSCCVGDFDENQIKQLLNALNKWKVITLVSFGFPVG